MKTKTIESLAELKKEFERKGRSYLLLYKAGSEKSDCALANIKATGTEHSDIEVMIADVNSVRDIHTEYNITTVPTLLEFDSGQFRNVYKGCHDPKILRALFDEAIYVARMLKEGKEIKRVTVYSTPTCTWCTTLKNYLNKNKIRYTDVDISRDSNAAQELVSRSGQQGVPQTEINGQWVIGFDQSKLNSLLEIK